MVLRFTARKRVEDNNILTGFWISSHFNNVHVGSSEFDTSIKYFCFVRKWHVTQKSKMCLRVCLLNDVRADAKRSILNRFHGFVKHKHGTCFCIVDASPFARVCCHMKDGHLYFSNAHSTYSG